jgi:hypothetical protein
VKYLGKSFSSPANSAEYVRNWDAVFGEKQDEDDCPAQPCPRCEEAGIEAKHDMRACTQPRPWVCFCYARMAGECMCGAWDDA